MPVYAYVHTQDSVAMDLIFERGEGLPAFEMEVGYFDTVREIKEKIEKKMGIPASKQTLIFNAHPLPDDLNVHHSLILDRSHINLLVTPDAPLRLLLNTPKLSSRLQIQIDPAANVALLKKRVHEIGTTCSDSGIPVDVDRLILSYKGKLLEDDGKLLREYGLSDSSEIEIGVRPPNKVRVKVVSSSETKKITVEVKLRDSVAQLRKKLEILHESAQFPLPEKGYFFIHKQSVMEEDKSFFWHRVEDGDTIEVFNGTVTTETPSYIS